MTVRLGRPSPHFSNRSISEDWSPSGGPRPTDMVGSPQPGWAGGGAIQSRALVAEVCMLLDRYYLSGRVTRLLRLE